MVQGCKPSRQCCFPAPVKISFDAVNDQLVTLFGLGFLESFALPRSALLLGQALEFAHATQRRCSLSPGNGLG
jgi:hypothetical protein